MNYIISSTTDLQRFSAVDVSFKYEKLLPSFPKALGDIKAIISPEVYAVALAYAETPTDPVNPVLQGLVERIQAPFWNLAMYYHFIWLQLRVSNNKLSILKNEKEQPLNKGQLIEAKESLMEMAHSYLSDLIDYLNENKADILDGTTEVWTESAQYKAVQNLLFTGYRDFDSFYSIDNSAVFYYRAANIIRKVISEQVESRVGPIDKIITPETGEPDADLIYKLKCCISGEVVAKAIKLMPFVWLPGSLRQTIDQELYASGGKDDTTVRERIGREIAADARNEWVKLDMHLATPEENDLGELELLSLRNEMDETLPFASMI